MASGQTGKRRILLVDDDTSLLDTLNDFLTYEGYEVETATSGEQARPKLRLVGKAVWVTRRCLRPSARLLASLFWVSTVLKAMLS